MPETLSLQARQQLEEAVSPALERIRQDREGAPLQIQRLLVHIEHHLLDPELDVTQAKRACGIGDNSVAIQFHSVVGRPPSSYIEDRRLETASRLLAESDFKIWQVAQVTGYSSISAFSRAFLRWSGERPSGFRKKRQLKMRRADAGTSEARASLHPLATHTEVDQDLLQLLSDLCPQCQQKVAEFQRQRQGAQASSSDQQTSDGRSELPVGVDISGALPKWKSGLPDDETDRYRAELIWSELENCNWAERRELVSQRLRLTSPSFFHFLREKSWELGRRSLKESVRVAQLALDSLRSLEIATLSPGKKADLYLQGWTCLALAQIQASDLDSAAESLHHAEGYLGHPDCDPTIEAEMLCVKATLLRNLRRSADAKKLFDRAFSLCPSGTRPELLAQLLIRRATLYYEDGELDLAIADLEVAREHLEDVEDAHLRLSAYQALAVCLEAAGRFTEAIKIVPLARLLCSAEDKLSAVRLRWLEGRLQKATSRYEEAEKAFLEAQQTFLDQEHPYCAAFACLDLADLYARQHRGAELRSLSIRLAPLFEALQLQREALTTLKIFRHALETENLSAAMVTEIRQGFAKARKLPRRETQ